jgi:hypothetical protein
MMQHGRTYYNVKHLSPKRELMTVSLQKGNRGNTLQGCVSIAYDTLVVVYSHYTELHSAVSTPVLQGEWHIPGTRAHV